MEYVAQFLVFLLAILGAFFKCVREDPPGKVVYAKMGFPAPTTSGIVIMFLLVLSFGASIGVALKNTATHEREQHELTTSLKTQAEGSKKLAETVQKLADKTNEQSDSKAQYAKLLSQLTEVTALIRRGAQPSVNVRVAAATRPPVINPVGVLYRTTRSGNCEPAPFVKLLHDGSIALGLKGTTTGNHTATLVLRVTRGTTSQEQEVEIVEGVNPIEAAGRKFLVRISNIVECSVNFSIVEQ